MSGSTCTVELSSSKTRTEKLRVTYPLFLLQIHISLVGTFNRSPTHVNNMSGTFNILQPELQNRSSTHTFTLLPPLTAAERNLLTQAEWLASLFHSSTRQSNSIKLESKGHILQLNFQSTVHKVIDIVQRAYHASVSMFNKNMIESPKQ